MSIETSEALRSVLQVTTHMTLSVYGGSPCCRRLNDTPVEFKVELKVVRLKPFSSAPVEAGTFDLERSTLMPQTRPQRRQLNYLP